MLLRKLVQIGWIYQDIEDLLASCSGGRKPIERFECSVFDGKYITGDITEKYLEQLEANRREKLQSKDMEKSRYTQLVDITN